MLFNPPKKNSGGKKPGPPKKIRRGGEKLGPPKTIGQKQPHAKKNRRTKKPRLKIKQDWDKKPAKKTAREKKNRVRKKKRWTKKLPEALLIF